MKKLILLLLFVFSFTTLAFANSTKEKCQTQGDDFIFAARECIQFAISEGDTDGIINIIVHGTWDKGTNTLGRYAPFAETLSMNTDITSIAIALPGYSKSTTNTLKDLTHGGASVYTKEYINFIAALVKALKEKFEAKTVHYIGHSAGASLGVNMLALHPQIVDSITAAGGRFNLEKFKKDERRGLITIDNSLDKIGNTKLLLVYGTEDKISKPEVTINFYEKAKKAGADVKLVKAEGAVHIDLDMTDESVDAITEMIAPE